MFRTHSLCCLIAIVVANDMPSASAEPVKSDGKVSHVTLYRGQALVTREIPIDGEKGSLEVVVGNLPEQVVPGSMFAEGGESIEVRAVQYRNRAVGQEPREEVRALDEQIDATQQKIALNTKSQELLVKRTQYLDNLEGFVAPTAKTELSKGVLDAKALQEMTKFSFEQRTEIAKEQVTLEQEGRDLQKELELLHRKRSELTSGSEQLVREAVLFIQKHADGKETVTLNYLVSNCGWSPTYTMRAGADRKKVQVEYNALIHQLSGEDWGDVALSLSTASPALSATGPGLAPFRVVLGSNADGKLQVAGNQQEALSQVQSLNTRRYDAVIRNQNTGNFRDNTTSSWDLNGIAVEFQCLELLGDKNVVSAMRIETNDAGAGPSISYRLAGVVSLPSRNDQQMVRILQSEFNSQFYHVATPVLTSYVYREAELTNSSQEDLLAGPITVYLDGRFVGQSEIPTVARGQAFVVGFGADPQLRARRELAEKTDGVQGGNRELKFTYRVVVDNYKDEATQLRIVERLPNADRDSEIRVTVGEMSDDLSEDKLYVRQERPMGILRWDITAPAGAVGEDAKLIQYGFTVEYDRNFVLTSSASQQQEFEQLQRLRQKR